MFFRSFTCRISAHCIHLFQSNSLCIFELSSEQVVSLTLSDDEIAPGQSELRPSQRVESVALIL